MQKKTPAKVVQKRQSSYPWIIRTAAAVIVGFMAGALYNHTEEKTVSPQVTYIETIVPYGSRNLQILADGTKVWLNAGSKLRYATNFGQTSREVYLEGEAYFDVAKDTGKIFIVKTDKLNIKALGTSFNVKAYIGEPNIEAILVKGKISINDQVVLTPNEKGVYSRKNEQFIIEKKTSKTKLKETPAQTEQTEPPYEQPMTRIVETSVDPTIYTSWKDELWRIESETLASLAVKLERRYDVKIRFADKDTQALSINAVIKDESLEQVLRFLQLSIPIDFTIDGKAVVLKENKYLKERYKNYYKNNSV